MVSLLQLFALTLLSRLLPGPTTLLAVHRTTTRGRAAGAAYLGLLGLADLATFTLLWAGGERLLRLDPGPLLPHLAAAALLAAGVVLLLRARRRRPIAEGDGDGGGSRGSLSLGAALALSLAQPGRWTWWASFGLLIVTLAVRGGVPFAAALGAFAAALAAGSALVLAAAERARAAVPGRAERYAEVALGAVLALAAVAWWWGR